MNARFEEVPFCDPILSTETNSQKVFACKEGKDNSFYIFQVRFNHFNILLVMRSFIISEPRREKPCFMSYANNKDADQPVHLSNLISAFVVRCLDSMMLYYMFY